MTVGDFTDADHVASARGQTVHANKALFVAALLPNGTIARIKLGFEIGAGMTFGCVGAVGLIMAASKLLKVIGL